MRCDLSLSSDTMTADRSTETRNGPQKHCEAQFYANERHFISVALLKGKKVLYTAYAPTNLS
jgi:hypothetical protein